jgi:hypothetical protein
MRLEGYFGVMAHPYQAVSGKRMAGYSQACWQFRQLILRLVEAVGPASQDRIDAEVSLAPDSLRKLCLIGSVARPSALRKATTQRKS